MVSIGGCIVSMMMHVSMVGIHGLHGGDAWSQWWGCMVSMRHGGDTWSVLHSRSVIFWEADVSFLR